MNGQADQIKRTDKSLEERGIPADSFFEAAFSDGSSVSEKESNWSDMSEERRVGYFGGTKTVMVCKFPVRCVLVRHGELLAFVDVPEGSEAYQAVRSETVILDGKKEHRILGRVVGVIRDGEVVEEKFLNGVENAVLGVKQ